ncbi:hypothetical protein DSL72_008754 [Monilinia vaccinii-corymbosi]|uniref:PARP catalytic domain-containing protein n=1 Tax=Monilinia vaccinii-corymbosi TaxID=61207 RepID=A0A8A3PS07_9HELO|nr:hypothetical protein DSL72_008754 [Monilinia vaccinii-corymbosi]
MPRKQFLADIETASEKGIPNVVSISRGEDDGDVNFCFLHPSTEPIDVGLLALDVSGYPDENSFMVFTKSHGAPKAVIEALNQLTPSPNGIRVADLIGSISQKLQKALSTGSQGSPISLDDDEDVEMDDVAEEQSEDDSGFSDDYEEDFPDEPIPFSNGNAVPKSTTILTPRVAAQLNRRIRIDVRALRMAGFRIGILSGMKAESQNSILSISIQATKLGLSEEAMQAWDIESNQHVTLLIRYSEGYKTYEAVIDQPAKNSGVDFRIGVGDGYKPSATAAFSAFSDVNKAGAKHFNNDKSTPHKGAKNQSRGFSNIFISSSLNEFINTKMISILKVRNATGFGWEDAKEYFDERQGRPLEANSDLFPEKLYSNTNKGLKSHSSQLLTDDHLINNNGGSISFPLLAGQFALMYIVRCTEFCLVCHDKITDEFEALKPYVCDKPLCLYQYMSLGFGPSVEHEIQTQPYVVDLLLNFCYTSAWGNRIREYPTGMSLSVPPAIVPAGHTMLPTVSSAIINGSNPASKPSSINPQGNVYDVDYDAQTQEATFEKGNVLVHNGDWVRIFIGLGPGGFVTQALHFRVEDISSWPIVKLSAPIRQRVLTGTYKMPASSNKLAVNPTPGHKHDAKLTVYNCNFDKMSSAEKCNTITMLLDTLPSVKDLKEYIYRQSQTEEPNLRKWTERLSPAALGLLRWVIASNRSCLVQVDRFPGQSDTLAKIRPEQKVSQIGENWVQFRFAQGSPDKELRFLNALKEQQAILNPKYPTMFAFHGSALQNWHSIIRHGLDFKETLNGRAYGHGVYHAQDQSVSSSYSSGRNIMVSFKSFSIRLQSNFKLELLAWITIQYFSCDEHQ